MEFWQPVRCASSRDEADPCRCGRAHHACVRSRVRTTDKGLRAKSVSLITVVEDADEHWTSIAPLASICAKPRLEVARGELRMLSTTRRLKLVSPMPCRAMPRSSPYLTRLYSAVNSWVGGSAREDHDGEAWNRTALAQDWHRAPSTERQDHPHHHHLALRDRPVQTHGQPLQRSNHRF